MATKNNVVPFQYLGLTKENYDEWSLRTKTILCAQGLKGIVQNGYYTTSRRIWIKPYGERLESKEK